MLKYISHWSYWFCWNVLILQPTLLHSHILEELLTKTSNIVYCLIRASKSKSGLTRLTESMELYLVPELISYLEDRIIVIEGDLGGL